MLIDVGNIFCKCHYSGIELKKGIDQELDEYLKIKRPSTFFGSRATKQNFDNYRHFYSVITHKFPTGFLPQVVEILKDLGVTYELNDTRGEIPRFTTDLCTTYGEDEMFDTQKGAMLSIDRYVDNIYFPRAIIDAATNAGKTMIMMGWFDNIENCKALVLIHSQLVRKQLIADFAKFFGDIGEISSDKFSIQPITVAMNKTLLNRLSGAAGAGLRKEINKYFNVVIIDEGHKVGGEEYQKLLKLLDIPIRLAISGTALESGNKVKAISVVAQTGPVTYKITNQQMIESGQSKKPKVHMILTKHPAPKVCISYEDFVHEHKFYNPHQVQKIRELLTLHEEKQFVIIFDEIHQGLWLYEQLKDFWGVEVVHGKDSFREQKIEKFKKYECRILLTSTILKEGINIKNIDAMVNLLGEESTITLKQFMGRGLRTMKGGTKELLWYDFFHDCKHLDDHSRARIRVYKKEGYEIVYDYEASNFGTPKRKKKS